MYLVLISLIMTKSLPFRCELSICRLFIPSICLLQLDTNGHVCVLIIFIATLQGKPTHFAFRVV